MGYCTWAGMNEANRIYHDTEWGIPERDDRHMHAAVSFAPVRREKNRPDPFLTITFGMPYRKESTRIDVAVEPYFCKEYWRNHCL